MFLSVAPQSVNKSFIIKPTSEVFGEQRLSNLHSATLNYVHVVLRPGVIAICAEGPPEVAPQSTSSSYHRCHDRTEEQVYNECYYIFHLAKQGW